ncbi:PH domain-containing protein [Paenibacillus sp. Marseille-Q4541]|uniref:PH domain-containing protein n=1 Tax=Paenibacillus sp. Marseille-Q4541 TaxID=2831522 RepID=UPI001BAD8862|nr:PH domain-containing protein [Paenibacillus sp. Marseille-Q4541]
MHTPIPEPQNLLSKDAIKVWMIKETIENIIAFIILGILIYLDIRFSWVVWIGWILYGLAGISILVAIWSIFIRPYVLYHRWRYDVSSEFLQLKFGTMTEVNQLVPMTKIQAVSTRQGPLLRKYDLYAIDIETMGSSHKIPALPKEVALELRDNIAHFAKIKEVDE